MLPNLRNFSVPVYHPSSGRGKLAAAGSPVPWEARKADDAAEETRDMQRKEESFGGWRGVGGKARSKERGEMVAWNEWMGFWGWAAALGLDLARRALSLTRPLSSFFSLYLGMPALPSPSPFFFLAVINDACSRDRRCYCYFYTPSPFFFLKVKAKDASLRTVIRVKHASHSLECVLLAEPQEPCQVWNFFLKKMKNHGPPRRRAPNSIATVPHARLLLSHPSIHRRRPLPAFRPFSFARTWQPKRRPVYKCQLCFARNAKKIKKSSSSKCDSGQHFLRVAKQTKRVRERLLLLGFAFASATCSACFPLYKTNFGSICRNAVNLFSFFFFSVPALSIHCSFNIVHSRGASTRTHQISLFNDGGPTTNSSPCPHLRDHIIDRPPFRFSSTHLSAQNSRGEWWVQTHLRTQP